MSSGDEDDSATNPLPLTRRRNRYGNFIRPSYGHAIPTLNIPSPHLRQLQQSQLHNLGLPLQSYVPTLVGLHTYDPLHFDSVKNMFEPLTRTAQHPSESDARFQNRDAWKMAQHELILDDEIRREALSHVIDIQNFDSPVYARLTLPITMSISHQDPVNISRLFRMRGAIDLWRRHGSLQIRQWENSHPVQDGYPWFNTQERLQSARRSLALKYLNANAADTINKLSVEHGIPFLMRQADREQLVVPSETYGHV